MSQVLLVNLRRFGDIFGLGHIIAGLNASRPGVKISLIVYKESLAAAKVLSGVHNIYTIDRKEIVTLKKNPIFNDGFALERVYQDLKDVKATRWSDIINTSNDTVAAHLCGYLRGSASKVTGMSYNSSGVVIPSSDWDEVYNSLLPTLAGSPIHITDCLHQMTATTAHADTEKVSLNTKHNETAFKNINHIRNQKGPYAKVIGVQLFASSTDKELSYDASEALISALLGSDDYVPLVLHAPDSVERERVKNLNQRFSNRLVTVEADFNALSSVLLNLDLLVTVDTSVMHLADLNNTPVIELSLGPSPFLKQGPRCADSLVLSPRLTTRVFERAAYANNPELAKTNHSLGAGSIIGAIDYFFKVQEKPILDPNITMYKVVHDGLGVRYQAIGGSVDNRSEIQRLMSRTVLLSLFDREADESILEELRGFDSSTINAWCEREKFQITAITRDLLGTLRSLLKCLESKRAYNDFVTSLDRLLTHGDSDAIGAIPTVLFRSRIEAINPNLAFNDKVKVIESFLYELKSDLQLVFRTLKSTEASLPKGVPSRAPSREVTL